MLKQRILTAIPLVLIMLASILLFSSVVFALLMALVCALAAWEWAHLCGMTSKVAKSLYVAQVMLCLCLCALGQYHWPSLSYALILVAALWWWLALWWVARYPAGPTLRAESVAMRLLGMALLSTAWLSLFKLTQAESAWVGLIWLMLIIWSADIGAYAVGRCLGGRKLAARVSPGKTWSGFVGGLMASSVVSGLWLLWVVQPVQPLAVEGWVAALLGLLISLIVTLASVVGDLFESLIKRQCGVKDSGGLLPGHGGVLDRIDSLCAAAPWFVLLVGV